jgi:alanyl-tRNA synthetase
LARAARAAGEELESLLARGKTMNDAELPEIVAMIQRDVAGSIPIRSRRRAQAVLVEFAARIKAFKNTTPSSGPSGIDVAATASRLIGAAELLGTASLVVGDIPGATDEQLRQTIDLIRKKITSYGILLAGANDTTVNFVAVVSDDVIARGLKAGDWVRQAAKAAGGGGGGRPQMAQAGGKDPTKTPDALAAAIAFAKSVVQ